MSNRNELAKARRTAREANESLRRIRSLPRRNGESIVWRNGVIWMRVGDDDWRADSLPEIATPSAHVASLDWERFREGVARD